jgi:hypothetical protein
MLKAPKRGYKVKFCPRGLIEPIHKGVKIKVDLKRVDSSDPLGV